ncbi:hypothetical protein Pcinc_033017 [Petrolisthes cinctipes]|uniref:Uncharacterized protein n=1 Tax=Petrolisthes cinctipes TaxID=88211 RepID=A0AAE1ESW9_PETCI|nr:hypothetical protein Pcinc_033017 [Petrolisthes cinctipes]
MDEGLVRRQSVARGWASRASRALKEILDTPDVTRVQLEDAMEDFDRRMATLDDVQASLELEISDPKFLEEDIENADSFRWSVKAVRVDTAQKLVDLSKAEQVKQQPQRHSDSSSVASAFSSVQLSRLELSKLWLLLMKLKYLPSYNHGIPSVQSPISKNGVKRVIITGLEHQNQVQVSRKNSWVISMKKDLNSEETQL